jgi:hypothetical protein
MARTTNSNLLRLGSNLAWDGSHSLNHSLFVFTYLPYLLDRLFVHFVDEAFVGPGPVTIKHSQGKFIVVVTLYNFVLKSPSSRIFKRFHYISLIVLLRNLSSGFDKNFLRATLVFCFRPYRDWDALFVLNYFKLRLGQDFSVFSILNSLRRLLARVPGLLGYRVDVTGRYARQQRATKLSIKRGLITLSELAVNVTYVEDFIILKHGKCGFKVWVNRLPSYTSRSQIFQL